MCSDDIRTALGSAKSIRIQAFGFRRTPTSSVTIKMWETCVPDVRPNDVIPGGSAFFTSTAVTSLRPSPEQISGPFSSNVNFTLHIVASTGTNLEEWDGAVYATLILEE